MAKLSQKKLQDLARQAVLAAQERIPGESDDAKRRFATEHLYQLVERYDDYVPALGKWAGRAAGVKVQDNAMVDRLQRWLCEQLVRVAWVGAKMEQAI